MCQLWLRLIHRRDELTSQCLRDTLAHRPSLPCYFSSLPKAGEWLLNTVIRLNLLKSSSSPPAAWLVAVFPTPVEVTERTRTRISVPFSVWNACNSVVFIIQTQAKNRWVDYLQLQQVLLISDLRKTCPDSEFAQKDCISPRASSFCPQLEDVHSVTFSNCFLVRRSIFLVPT